MCFGHLSRLDGWILVLWSRRFTPVVFFFISWFYKECPGYFQESHIFIKGIFIFRHYYYHTLFQSLEVELFSCWAAIRVPAILVETVTLHNQLSRCVSVCQVSVPSSSSQQSTILKCHILLSILATFLGIYSNDDYFFLFKSESHLIYFQKQASHIITLTGNMTVYCSFITCCCLGDKRFYDNLFNVCDIW